jgi:hypothetical protein
VDGVPSPSGSAVRQTSSAAVLPACALEDGLESNAACSPGSEDVGVIASLVSVAATGAFASLRAWSVDELLPPKATSGLRFRRCFEAPKSTETCCQALRCGSTLLVTRSAMVVTVLPRPCIHQANLNELRRHDVTSKYDQFASYVAAWAFPSFSQPECISVMTMKMAE